MNDDDLRDLFAGLAMSGLIRHFDFETYKQDPKRVASWAYEAADAMIEAKYYKPDEGIASVKPRKKRVSE